MIKRTLSQIANKISHWIDVLDYYLDKGYGYIYDAVMIFWIVAIFSHPLVGIYSDQDPTSWHLLGLYVLFAYFIGDHVLTTKFGSQRARFQLRERPEDRDEQ